MLKCVASGTYVMNGFIVCVPLVSEEQIIWNNCWAIRRNLPVQQAYWRMQIWVFDVYNMTFNYFPCGGLSWLYRFGMQVVEFCTSVVFGSYFVVYQEASQFCFLPPVKLLHEHFPLTAIAPVARDHHGQYLCCAPCSSWASSMEPL